MHTKKVRLSDSVIRSLDRPKGAKRARFWDLDIPGLLIEVSATQSRFAVRHEGEYKTLGTWPFLQVEVGSVLVFPSKRAQ
jgi:hypothetical protein